MSDTGTKDRRTVVAGVESSLRRIAQLDPELCAFLEVWEESARARALAVDLSLPLAGLPFAVKGPSGIRSYAAERLMAAGAVPVGSTAVPGPGTYWQTWGLGRYGRTVNPYRRDRTPGGSSAGSGVAVAAGMVPLATGSDGAGSVRIPAAWCGVFGLKTTNGLLPSPDRTGLAAAGVLTRRVADAEAYLRCLRDDALVRTGAGVPPEKRPIRAVFSEDLGFARVDPEVTAVVRRAVERLVQHGVVHLSRERGPFALLDPRDAWLALRGASGTEAEKKRGDDAGPPATRGPHGPGRDGDGAEAGSQGNGGNDAGTAVVRPRGRRAGARGIPEAGQSLSGGRAIREAPKVSSAREVSGTRDVSDMREVNRVREENDGRLEELFSRVPLLITPVTPNRPHGHKGPGALYSTALTWAFNLSGHPAVSIPVGRTSDGCPVGLQVVADRYGESALLNIGRAAEGCAVMVGP